MERLYRYLKRTEAPYSSVKHSGSCLDKYITEIESAFKSKLKAKGYIGSDSLLRMHLSKEKKP